MAMLDAVDGSAVEENSVAAIKLIFEVGTTFEYSGIALVNQAPQTQDEPEASGLLAQFHCPRWWLSQRVAIRPNM